MKGKGLDMKEPETIQPDYLRVVWSISRGRETYGYNICSVRPAETGKTQRCSGGGYDMLGTSVGNWIEDAYQGRLQSIREMAGAVYRDGHGQYFHDGAHLDGMVNYVGGSVRIDGACGIEEVLRIARAIGLTMTATYNRKGHVTGYLVGAA